jgi:hypothetical protein
MGDLRSALLEVRSQHGALTPRLVVESARPAESPLHDRFEWNDSVAGESWRREQARDLIQSVRIEYAESKSGPREVRAFVSVRDGSLAEPVFVPVAEAMSDEWLSAQVLADCERAIAELKRRFGHLREFRALLVEAAA